MLDDQTQSWQENYIMKLEINLQKIVEKNKIMVTLRQIT
jgi:hypothetical protein